MKIRKDKVIKERWNLCPKKSEEKKVTIPKKCLKKKQGEKFKGETKAKKNVRRRMNKRKGKERLYLMKEI